MRTDKNGIVYLSEQELAKKGWTKTAITKFLGNPDWSYPYVSFGQKVHERLYKVSRILDMEETHDWKVWISSSRHRRATSSQNKITKAQRNMEEIRQRQKERQEDINNLTIRFIQEPQDMIKLRMLSKKHWLPTSEQHPNFRETPEENSDRIIINYLRHQCTNYDYIITYGDLKGQGYAWVNRMVHDLIADKYPELQNGCEKRLQYVNERNYQWEDRYKA